MTIQKIKTQAAYGIALFSMLAFVSNVGNFHQGTPLEQNLIRQKVEIFQTPPCDPVNDPSSCEPS